LLINKAFKFISNLTVAVPGTSWRITLSSPPSPRHRWLWAKALLSAAGHGTPSLPASTTQNFQFDSADPQARKRREAQALQRGI